MATDAEKIEALRAVLGELEHKNHHLAESLLSQWEKKGHLSRKQWYWVSKLSGLTSEKKKDKKKTSPKSKPDPRYEAMLSAFQRANAGQRKRVMRALHPDVWDGAEWATELFQAVNQ